MKHTETPGLGSLATQESFYRKFDNRNLVPVKVVRTAGTAGAGEDEIVAITSATITTRAITNAVNEAIEWFNGGGLQ
jgi:electron transport complex protein RnfG